MKRTIKDLSRREMKEIAEEYANTQLEVTGDVLSEKYNISGTTFYDILHKAILESMVSKETAEYIKRKAADNAERHGGEGAKHRTSNYYNKLIKQRDSYRLRRYDAKPLISRYLTSRLTLELFAKCNDIDKDVFRRALGDAVIYSWITDSEVKKLKELTKKQKRENVDEKFEKLLKAREENLKKRK